MSIKKAIALILILALLAGGGYYLLKTEQEDSDRMRNLYTEVEPLERQRENLQTEKKNLETEYATKMRDYGTVEILFTELDAQIVTDVWPIMRERGVVGTLGVNFKEAPLTYNKMSADDVARLVADGWGTCCIVDAPVGADFKYWWDQFTKFQQTNHMPIPTTIYFINDTYDVTLHDDLIACGIRTVILDAADGRSHTVTDFSGDLWLTGAMPWGYTGSQTDLELLGRTDSSNLVLTMKLKETWDKSKNKNVESQEKQAFISTLDSWKDYLYEEDPLEQFDTVGPTPYIYVDTKDPEVMHEIYLNSLTAEQKLLLPKFRSVSVDTALNLHRTAMEEAGPLRAEMNKKEAELDQQLAALEIQIRETYERYGVGQKEGLEKNS